MNVCFAIGVINPSKSSAKLVLTFQLDANRSAFGGENEDSLDYECVDIPRTSPGQQRRALDKLREWAHKKLSELIMDSDSLEDAKEALDNMDIHPEHKSAEVPISPNCIQHLEPA